VDLKPAKRCADCDRPLSKKRKAKRRCYSCEVAHKRELSERAHDRRVQTVYGLKPGEYQKLYEAQDGKCALCRRATGRTRRLAVEHNHKLGFTREAVRGLCCKTCNRYILGFGGEDIEFYLRVVAYLRYPPAQRILGED
jgi:Recombination endonuclease VII